MLKKNSYFPDPNKDLDLDKVVVNWGFDKTAKPQIQTLIIKCLIKYKAGALKSWLL